VTKAEPVLDTTGSGLLFAPPRAVASSGGHLPVNGVSGAVLGLWTDERIVPTGTSIMAGTARSAGEAVTSGYASFALPPTGVAYECLHANGVTERVGEEISGPTGDDVQTSGVTGGFASTAASVSRSPLRLGCSEGSAAGAPALAGGLPAPECSRQNQNVGYDCGAEGACEPANLVAGSSSQDGRCALIGVAW
jgi:hypothetical protein